MNRLNLYRILIYIYICFLRGNELSCLGYTRVYVMLHVIFHVLHNRLISNFSYNFAKLFEIFNFVFCRFEHNYDHSIVDHILPPVNTCHFDSYIQDQTSYKLRTHKIEKGKTKIGSQHFFQ